MKQLPEEFPIRYALIVSMYDSEDRDNSFLGEVLFNEYLLLLRDRPLNYSLLFPSYISLDFTILDQKAFQISKLYADDSWPDMVKQKIKEILPESFPYGFSAGRAFSIGLYSYKRSYELPAFFKFRNKLNHYNSKHFNKIYERVKRGELDEWDLYRLLGDNKRAIRQDLYYSNVWKKLDEDKELEGSILSINSAIEALKFKDLPQNKSTKKIPVLICRSWDALFAEEIYALYKMFNFCSNCGKALPFDYSGKYCPATPENTACLKERARKRKRSQNKI